MEFSRDSIKKKKEILESFIYNSVNRQSSDVFYCDISIASYYQPLIKLSMIKHFLFYLPKNGNNYYFVVLLFIIIAKC